MANLLDGKKVRAEIEDRQKKIIGGFSSKPTLLIVQAGDRPDSTSYIKQKKKCAEAIGAIVIHRKFPETVTEKDILDEIMSGNRNPDIHGIIVQMPLPAGIDRSRVIETILPAKDVDGLTPVNMNGLLAGGPSIVPATTRGILTLLDYYSIPIAGKKVTVVGRSMLVGRPTALAFLLRDATVTIAHRKTADLPGATRPADILVVAAGKPGLIGLNEVSSGQVVIDVGITAISDATGSHLIGDVSRAEVEPVAGWLSPVPGGVGPMTVVSLFENLIDAYRLQSGNK